MTFDMGVRNWVHFHQKPLGDVADLSPKRCVFSFRNTMYRVASRIWNVNIMKRPSWFNLPQKYQGNWQHSLFLELFQAWCIIFSVEYYFTKKDDFLFLIFHELCKEDTAWSFSKLKSVVIFLIRKKTHLSK